MHSRYLQGDPVPLLREEGSPVVRYLLKRDIEGGETGPGYETLLSDPGVEALLHKEKGGVLGNRRRFDLYYHGAQWCLAEAVEYGLDGRTESVDSTARFVAEKTSTPDGGYTMNWKPRIPAACRTGEMVRALAAVHGSNDDSVKRGIEWICRNQRHDGGWLHCPLGGACDMMKLALLRRAGNGMKRENDPAVSSCFYATASCMGALLAAGKDNGEVLHRGSEFFLNRKLFLGRGGEPIVPKNAWNRDFRLLGYPLMCQYDILTGLDVAAHCGRGSDERISPAFNILMKKQNGDGTWNLEQAGTGMLYGPDSPAQKDRYNPMVTLRALRFLKNFGE